MLPARVILLLLLTVLLAAACGPRRLEKQFPGGDPAVYEEHDRLLSEYRDTEPPAPDEAPRIRIPTNRTEDRGLLLTVQVPQPRVRAGTSIEVHCMVRNQTAISIPVTYTSEQRFDVTIFTDRAQTRAVYVWSTSRYFAPLFTDRMLGGGSNISDRMQIPTTADPVAAEMLPNDLSRPLTPGTYYLWGTHAGTPYLAAGPMEIVVEP